MDRAANAQQRHRLEPERLRAFPHFIALVRAVHDQRDSQVGDTERTVPVPLNKHFVRLAQSLTIAKNLSEAHRNHS